jgi:cytochrome bd-type quinol oxidase subunit 1
LLAAAEQKGNGRLPYALRFGLCFLLTSQLSVIVYGHLHAYQFNYENYPTHIIGVPFTFLLPLLLAASPEIYQKIKRSTYARATHTIKIH